MNNLSLYPFEIIPLTEGGFIVISNNSDTK
jgi:hypothetical protein